MRHADHEIDPMFLKRSSPRAMSGEPVTEGEVLLLLEAARWAPSSGNGQPWRFVWARRGSEAFDALLGTLVEGNRVWCIRAGAFLLVASATAQADGRPVPTHAFDAGAAWMSLALQGSKMGLVVHAMAGFDQEAARRVAAVPADHGVHCVVAVGRPGRVEELPEKLRPREEPNGRNPVSSFAFEGRFPT